MAQAGGVGRAATPLVVALVVVGAVLLTSAPGSVWFCWFWLQVASGRWSAPHRGEFVPQRFTSSLQRHAMFEHGPIVVDRSLDALAEAFAPERALRFAAGSGARVSHAFPDGTPCRSELTDVDFLRPAERELARRLGGVKPFQGKQGLAVYQVENPHGLPEPTEGWVSEQWHIDNFADGGFKVIVYCSDVTASDAPFEHQDPPTLIPVLPPAPFRLTRLNYAGSSKQVLGPRGTTIFFMNSNQPHTGNYAVRGCRDVINFHFCLPH